MDQTLTLYHENCENLLFLTEKADAIITDPPYGIGYRVNQRNKSYGLATLKHGTKTDAVDPLTGDSKNFDPLPWLQIKRVALFGAEHYHRLLPYSGSWVLWDKRRDKKPDSHSDGEMIWLNIPGALRIHRQLWRGICREGEENCAKQRKLHPNQKPVALLTFIAEKLGLQAGMTVLDPFMGSGSTGIAVGRLGCNFIGIERDERVFITAQRRLISEFGDLVHNKSEPIVKSGHNEFPT